MKKQIFASMLFLALAFCFCAYNPPQMDNEQTELVAFGQSNYDVAHAVPSIDGTDVDQVFSMKNTDQNYFVSSIERYCTTLDDDYPPDISIDVSGNNYDVVLSNESLKDVFRCRNDLHVGTALGVYQGEVPINYNLEVLTDFKSEPGTSLATLNDSL